MSSNTIPLRSTTEVGSDYSGALSRHWATQVPDKYKLLWKRRVIDRDSGLHFTQNYWWPTRYYAGPESPNYDDTYIGRVRQADQLLCEP